jgi:hypothetical protein
MTWLIILIALWTYPIITLVLARLTKNRIIFRKRLIKITLIVTGLSIFGLITNISTTIKAVDWILVTSIYFSTCLFLWLSYYHFNKILRILAIVGMIGVYTVGYISGTIGALGVGFVIGEYDTKTDKWIGDGLIYKETPLGNAISDYRGKRVEIYRTISWIPIIEWRIMHKEYYNFITYGNDLKVEYQPDTKTIYLSATENLRKGSNLEIWSDTLKLGKIK